MGLKPIEKVRVLEFIKNVNWLYNNYDLISVLDKRKSVFTKHKETLEFLIEYTLKEISKESPSLSLVKRLLTALQVVVVNIDNARNYLTEELVESLKTIFVIYKKIEKNQDSHMEHIVDSITDVLSLNIITDNEESLIKINTLKERIKVLEQDLQKLSSEKERNSNTIEQLTSELDRVKKELKEIKTELKNMKLSNSELETLLLDKEDKISSLNEAIKNNDAEINTKSFEINRLSRNNGLLSKKILEYELKDYDAEMVEEIEKEAVELIIGLLMNGPVNEESIKEELTIRNLYLEDKEYSNILKRVRSRINILTTGFNGSKKYQLITPNYYKNQTLDLEADSECIDILLISDLHLTSAMNIERVFNKINNYASNNDISLILDLGDFFGFRNDNNDAYSRYSNGWYLVDKCINMIPTAEGIYHAILGGNHDKDSIKYGYDAIKELVDNREDFINLGYDSAILTINGKVDYKTSLLLHHLQHKVTDPISAKVFNPQDYQKYLEGYHNPYNIRLKNFYTTLIGGAHMSGIYNNFILSPSLINDRKYNGALHLKIFLNSNKEIENIIIINLIHDYNLIPTSEMVYKR